MFNVGPTELIVILIVALIVFGPKRLPEIGRTLGRSLQEFRRASNDLRQEIEQHLGEDPPPVTEAPGAREDAPSAAGLASGDGSPSTGAPDRPSHEAGTAGPTVAG